MPWWCDTPFDRHVHLTDMCMGTKATSTCALFEDNGNMLILAPTLKCTNDSPKLYGPENGQTLLANHVRSKSILCADTGVL